MDLDHLQTVYVTGLSEGVDEELLHAAFIPFGEITEIVLPKGLAGKVPLYALIQYECKEDALAAVDNMHRSELCGRPIRVSISNPAMLKQIASNVNINAAAKPVWEDPAWMHTFGKESSEN